MSPSYPRLVLIELSARRVGQMPFPSFYSNRGAWLLLAFYLSITLALDWIFIKWLVVICAVAMHTQYSAMMGFAIANSLGIKMFSITTQPQITVQPEADV